MRRLAWPHGRRRAIDVKVKLFVRDKSMFVGWRRYLEALEDEVNAWLADHPGIRIAHITQSSNGGSFDTSKVFLSVWYDDGPAAEFFPTAPRGGSTGITQG